MGRVLVDTDVCSYMFRSDSRAAPYYEYLAGRELCISVQTLAEIYQWAKIRRWGSRRIALLREWLEGFVIIYPDDDTAEIWAEIRTHRREIGRPISPQDAWIAACALRHGYPLVTHNPRDFEDIAGLEVVSFVGRSG